MSRNPAAQTAFGPMMLAAMEQSEPPGRRLVDDDLAARFLPAPTRWLVTATPQTAMRRLMMAVMERDGPGLWATMTCRKRYIADKVGETLDSIDAVVVLGAGLDTLAYRLARKESTSRSSKSTDWSTSNARPLRYDECSATCPVRFSWCRWTLSTTMSSPYWPSEVTAPTSRTFFIWEAVTQYLTADAVHATLESLRPAASGSRLVFTYVRRDFIDGVNLYGAGQLYRRFRQRQQLWQLRVTARGGCDLPRQTRMAVARAARPRADHAALRRTDRSQPDRVTGRVVGLRGQGLARHAAR